MAGRARGGRKEDSTLAARCGEMPPDLNSPVEIMPRALFALLAAILLAVAAPAFADDGAFTVGGVQVDVTEANAAKARERAFVEVPRIAFRRLLERLVPVAEQARVPELSDMQLDALVRDVQLEQEKASAVRYIASFTVRFKPDAVRGVLEAAQANYVDNRRSPVLVLPVFVGEGTVLWDDPNPWRQAWARRSGDGLVPVVVPLGELADVMAINAEQATAHDAAAIQAIARRYDTADVLLAVAMLSPGPGGTQVVDVETVGFGPGAPLGGQYSVAGRGGESAEALFARAADTVVKALGEGHKQRVVAGGAPDPAAAAAAGAGDGQVPALVALGGLDHWLAVRQRLSAVPQLRRLEVVSLNRAEAALILHHGGDAATLQDSLSRAGFSIAPGAGGAWLVDLPGPGGGAVR